MQRDKYIQMDDKKKVLFDYYMDLLPEKKYFMFGFLKKWKNNIEKIDYYFD